MSFKKGDLVVVVAAGPENAGTVGLVGVVVDDGVLSGGDVSVKGIDHRAVEAIKGYRSYMPHQLRKA
ncbi:hypothetical protein [Streptomyces tendae]|uniref:hypothetical protein n=1 Tax=Streptomyces tendae TaxID=1932 RepID=UPI0024932ADF|nr:hypothetical protein [Streptomyces tendae]